MEILIISGLSGAGKSHAATCLEDMGYYTVDNMPADIILKFAEFCAQSDGRYDRVAFVSDIRSGADGFEKLLTAIDDLRRDGNICRLIFITAEPEAIIKRYKETRRRHPLLTDGETLEDAMHREETLLRPIRERADFVFDTTQMPVGKLVTRVTNDITQLQNHPWQLLGYEGNKTKQWFNFAQTDRL